MSYDAGALRFMIQAAGRQAFETDMAAAQQAVEKTGRAASEAAPKVDAVGDATDRTGKKAKDAKAPLDEVGKTSKQVAGQSETLAQQIRRVEKELEAEGSASESLKQKLSRLKAEQAAQEQAAREQAAAAKELSQVMLIAGAATAAVVTLSVAKYAEFDEAMAQTSAATMASTEDQRILGEAALEAGADTAYSASEAANAQEELAKAGQSVADIVGGSLNGALALAAAGQLEVARSAEIMATTLTQFRLPAEQAAHVSDVLAAGAGKAQGSVEDMALALSYVGPVASGLKISLEETGGAIAYLASEGILGEKAGTALRGVLMSLTAPSAIAARTMGEYGIEIFDAQGNMKSLAEVSEILKRQLGGLTEAERSQALGRIFGNEQITAARILYSGGAKAIEEWTAAVDDSGYAAEQASMRQDNLAGDIEKLGGAFDTALIRTGAPANDMLREMVQIVTALVDMYGEMPAPVQTTAVVLGIATTAALLFGGAAVGIRARLIELQTELAKTNSSMRTTAIVGAAAGLALTGVITVVGILIAKQAEMNSATAEFADSLNESTGAVTSYTRELIAKKLADAGAFEQAQKAGVTQRELTDALYEGGDAYEVVIAKLREAHDATGGWDAGLGNTVNTVKDMNVQLTDAKTRHQDLEAATDEAKDSSKSAAEAYMDEAGSLQDVNDELRALIDSLFEVNGTNRDAVSANIQFQDALRAADDQIAKVREGAEGYARTLDITTDAGSRNTDVLLAIANAGEEAATAQYEVDGSAEQLRSTLEATHQAVMDRAMAFGATEEEARQLADSIAGIPSEKAFTVIAQTATAQGQIDDFVYRNADRTIALRIAAGPGGQGGITQADGGKVEFYANGGRSENHIAQFARAGTYRVWAEDETGGEWYLPNSEAKRPRSLAIAEQMLGEWGYAMVPAAAQRYANGSAVSPTPTATAAGSPGMPPIHIDASGLTIAEVRSIVEEVVQRYFG